MSDAIFESKCSGLATKNDALRGAFERNGSRLFLLKRGQNTERFAVVAEVTTGWLVKFNEFRGQMVFKIATTSSSFADLISQTSYLAYGVPVEHPADTFIMETFEISPEFRGRDVISPNGSSVYWKVFASKVDERFTVPAEYLS